MRDQVRIAAVDMGSNTTRVVIADVTRGSDGQLTHVPVAKRSTITKLAEGVDTRGILLPVAITRVRSSLVEYRALARELGAVFVLATATSAVRDADNGEAFLGEVEHGFGFRAELLSGDQEAEATWAGVTSDASLAARAATGSGLLVDIGGGSTEVLVSLDGQVIDRHSFQLGSVRLTERHLGTAAHEGPVDPADMSVARHAVRSELRERFPEPTPVDLAIAVAGTATTVSAILLDRPAYDPELVHGFRFTARQLDSVVDRLAILPLQERRRVNGLEAGRAAVIVGGLIVLQETMAHFGLDEIETSERDILDGIALMAGRIALDEGIEELPEPFGRTVC